MTGRRAASSSSSRPLFAALRMIPPRPRIGAVGADRPDDRKIEAHVVGTPVQQLDGRRQHASQQEIALTYLKGRIDVHEPATDVPHEREAAAM